MSIWNILRPFSIIYDRLVYSVVIWYSLWSFGIFSRRSMFGPRKIWQLCSVSHSYDSELQRQRCCENLQRNK
jgi:hypothetical protein